MTSILSILIEVKALDQEWWFNMHTAEIYFLRFFDDSRINFQEALKLYAILFEKIMLHFELSKNSNSNFTNWTFKSNWHGRCKSLI